MNWSSKSLIILNLSQVEAVILNTCSISQNVQDIARLTSLSRTGINHALKGLISKGFIQYSFQGKRKAYQAIGLHELSLKLKAVLGQIDMADKNKKGTRVILSPQDEFVIHVGADEIIPAFKKIALETQNDRVKAIQHHRSFNDQVETATPKQIKEFNQAIIKNKIIVDGMLNESAYKSYFDEIKNSSLEKNREVISSLEGRMSDYSVFPDDRFNVDSEIWIFKTTTLIINWKDKVAIEIINKDMTSLLREMFEYVKQSSKKIDHNGMMRSLMENLGI